MYHCISVQDIRIPTLDLINLSKYTPRASVNNTQRDSVMTVDGNQEGAPNYFPNSFSGADHNKKWAQHVDTLTGDVARHDSSNDDNFSQVGHGLSEFHFWDW